MLEMLFSGKFPSSAHKNTYAGLWTSVTLVFNSFQSRGPAKCSWWSWKSRRSSKISTDKGNVCASLSHIHHRTATTSKRQQLKEKTLKEHGRGCCSTCCSGAFIVETMACVIINDQVSQLLVVNASSTFPRCPSWNLTSVRIQESGTRVDQSESMSPSTFPQFSPIYTLPWQRILTNENHNCPGSVFFRVGFRNYIGFSSGWL